MPISVVSGRRFNPRPAVEARLASAAGVGHDATVDPGVAFGFPVYTQAEIDGWSSAWPEYTALAADQPGRLTWTPIDFGTSITTAGQRTDLKNQAVHALVQAVLWAADGDPARLARVVVVLDGIKDIATYSVDLGQDNLVAGWFGSPLARAAAIVGYSNASFAAFLKNLIYPMLDWTAGGNWWMSFCDSRMAIAAYLHDPVLWADAKAYTEFHMTREYWHPTYDGDSVVPARSGTWPAKANGAVNPTRTTVHWHDQVDETLAAVYADPRDPGYVGTPFWTGQSSESNSDLSHAQMGNGAAAQALRTWKAQEGTVPQHLLDRLRASVDHHATRCLFYLDNGFTDAPKFTTGNGVNGNAGTQAPGISGAYVQGWRGLARLFAGDVPASVTSMLARSQVINADAGGDNHMVAEAFADRLAA